MSKKVVDRHWPVWYCTGRGGDSTSTDLLAGFIDRHANEQADLHERKVARQSLKKGRFLNNQRNLQ